MTVLTALCVIASFHGVVSRFLKAAGQPLASFDNQESKSAPQKPIPAAVANWAICNVSLPGYDDNRCFEHALGRTQAQLVAELQALEALNSTVTLSAVGKTAQCGRRFYLPAFGQFEQHFPGLALCHITTYAAIVQAAAMKSPCRAATPAEADIYMLPPYSALECNWPGYGAGRCDSQANTYRAGDLRCEAEIVNVAIRLQKQYVGKRMLIISQNPEWVPYNLDKASYSIEGHIWAKVNSLSGIYRPHVDFSMAPAAVDRCSKTPAKAYDEPVTHKKYFMSFLGAMQNSYEVPPNQHFIRQVLARQFNNGKDQVIVSSGQGYDFDELLQTSRFNLILRGDVEFSYRFNEAVCSGGVPVLVTDKWIPPFNEFLPFESYGVLVNENDLDGLVIILKALSDAEVEMRRKNARIFCQRAFQTTEASVSALMNHLTS